MRSSTNTEAKALAMSWVIHLMGDLHQPMHVTDRGDRGGNEFKVTYNGRTRCRESNSTGTEAKVELHSVWDSCLVFTLESGRTFDKLADALRGNLTTYKGHPAASGTMMEWMKETHQAGIDTAYDSLSNGDDLAGVYIAQSYAEDYSLKDWWVAEVISPGPFAESQVATASKAHRQP